MDFTGQQLVEGMPLGILITDLSGRITQANPTLAAMLDGVDVSGNALASISAAEAEPRHTEALRSIAAGDTSTPYVVELQGAEKTLVPVEMTGGAIRDAEGGIKGAIFTVKPLSEEMKLIKNLQRRNMHLLASSEVAKATTQILDIQELLTRCTDLIRIHFGFYYAAVFLVDEAGEWAVLRAATGDAGHQLLEKAHKLGVGSQSMVGWVTANNAARIAQDVGEEAIRFDNPLLPKTRSEMALPLRVRGEVIGALDAQSTNPNAFSAEDIQTIQMMADQVAIAIDNARLFSLRGS